MSVRTWALIIAALLALAFAAGCGGDDEEDGAEGTEAADTGAAAGTAEGLPEFSTVEEGLLTAGSDVPFPPFEFREGNELTGLDVDLVEEMASRLGIDEVR